MPKLTTPPFIATGHEAAIYTLCNWQQGILSGGGEGWIVHWPTTNRGSGALLAKIDDRVFCLLPLANGNLLAGTLTGDMYWFGASALRKEELPKRWRFHEDGLFAMVEVGEHVYAVGGKGRLSKWNIGSGEMQDSQQVDIVRLRSICYLNSLNLLAIGTANGDIHLVDTASLRTVHTIALAHQLTVFTLVDGGDRFYSTGRDGALRVWASKAPFPQLGYLAAHGATINNAALLEDTLATVSRDRELRLWDVTAAEPVLRKVLNAVRDGGHVASVNACVWLNQTLVTAGDDRTIRWWG